MARRQVSIFINGQEVARKIKLIRAEKHKIVRELGHMIEGSDEYNKKMKELDKLNAIINKHNQRIRGVESSWKKLASGAGKILAAAGVAFSVDAIVGYGKELYRAGVEMDTMNRVAQTVFQESLPLITQAARETAASIGLSKEEFKAQAVAIGDMLIPMGFAKDEAANFSIKMLELAGATAEATAGKVKTAEAAEIFRKAMLGEREALERLRIKISEKMITDRLQEKGMKGLTGEYLRQAKAAVTLELITEQSQVALQSFAQNNDSLIRRQSELTAKLTEVKDTIAILLIPVFERLVSIASGVVDIFSGVADAIGRMVDPAKAATDAFNEQQAATKDLEQQLLPLLDRYEVLQSKTNKSKKEQDDLKKIIAQIAKIVPTAVTEFDEYGKALGISTEKARELVEAQKLLTRQKNEKAIEKNTDALQSYKEQIEDINKALSKRDADGDIFRVASSFRKSGGEIETYAEQIKLSDEEIRKLTSNLEKLQKEALTTDNAIKLLSGESITPETITPEGPTRDEILQQAARAEELRKQREKQAKLEAKRRKKEAERQAKQLADKLNRLREIVEQGDEENRIRQLKEEEQAVEKIKQQYQKEIDIAKEVQQNGNAEQAAEALTQEKELLRIRDEEIRLLKEEFRLKEEEEKAAIKEELALAFLDERAAELLELELHYQELLAKAEEYGFDSAALLKRKQEEENRLKAKHQEKDAKAAAKIKKDKIKSDLDLFKKQKDLELERLKLYKHGLNQIAGIFEEGSALQKLFFLFDKALAAAEVVINLQKEVASLRAHAALEFGLLGPAISAPLIAKARVNAGISLGTIAATTVGEFAQKKKGGYLQAKGEDDNITYQTQYIGTPLTGMLPDHPVLMDSKVLASENGREYFVSNESLQNPVIANHVRIIDTIAQSRQFVEGGFNEGGKQDGGELEVTPLADPEQETALFSVMNRILELFEQGVVAVISDGTVIDIQERFNELDEASGGILKKLV